MIRNFRGLAVDGSDSDDAAPPGVDENARAEGEPSGTPVLEEQDGGETSSDDDQEDEDSDWSNLAESEHVQSPVDSDYEGNSDEERAVVAAVAVPAARQVDKQG